MLKSGTIRLVVVFLFSGTLFFFACRKDNLKPGIPAFIHTDSIGLNTIFIDEGSSSHKITDVWVYAEDQTIGAFEMPATIPILKDCLGKLRLVAGIKLNGISTTRIEYPFYKSIIIDDFNFLPDSVIIINPTTCYWETTKFVWMEDFENVSISLDTTSKSTVNIELTPEGSADTFEGLHSGFIMLNENDTLFEAASYSAYVLPTDGSPVFLELNYKNNNMFTVGVFAQTATQIIQDPVIFINRKENWNKIYINLTNAATSTSDAIDFKIFFGALKEDDVAEPKIYLDNIKLIYKNIN